MNDSGTVLANGKCIFHEILVSRIFIHLTDHIAQI